MTWIWPTTAETCRHRLTNKYDATTVVFWRTHPPSFAFMNLLWHRKRWVWIFFSQWCFTLPQIWCHVWNNLELSAEQCLSLKFLYILRCLSKASTSHVQHVLHHYTLLHRTSYNTLSPPQPTQSTSWTFCATVKLYSFKRRRCLWWTC
jgi:hypothetical protein